MREWIVSERFKHLKLALNVKQIWLKAQDIALLKFESGFRDRDGFVVGVDGFAKLGGENPHHFTT